MSTATHAQQDAALQNAARSDLGATAKGTGAPFNRDWPAANALGSGRGTIFGSPMTGATLEVRTVVPVDIQAIEIVPLDYNLTRLAKAVEIDVDGKPQGRFELPNEPLPTRIPVTLRGQTVTFKVVAEHESRTKNGKTGPNWGGFAALRIWTTTDVETLMSPVPGYQTTALPTAIAPTLGSIVEGAVRVEGEPRFAQGHPRTLWDAEDVARFKRMLTTSVTLKQQFDALRKTLDDRMAKPLGIPEPRQDDAGEWLHLPDQKFGKTHTQLSLDIANFGTFYQLSGEEKYAEFCKRLLLAYADAHPKYGIGARQGFSHDPSKVFDQRLGDAIWIIQVARGYDFIHDSPSLTDADRAKIEDDLVRASALHILGNRAMVRSPTNWSAISMAAVLMCGYATDDPELIQIGLYGRERNTVGTPDNILGGAFFHFGPTCIGPDGLWSEGAMGYQFMAMQALVTAAEAGWRNGIDLYRYRDGALKWVFDSPLQVAYPDLRTPALNDSGNASIVGRDSYLYEYAYLRYGDPRYLLILNQTPQHLAAQYQLFPLATLFDRDRNAPAPPVDWRSVNFFDVGFGILRTTDERGTVSLLMDYGPFRSHGHPDKLNLDLFAFGDILMPDPGIVWYEQPLYRNWYKTTMAHNALVVDGKSQSNVNPTLLVYGPADTMGIQRAAVHGVYAGVTLDRAVFLTSDYLADLFGAFARVERQLDLCWHIRGDFASDLPLVDNPLEPPLEPGYSELAGVRRTTTDQAWDATVTRKGKATRLLAAGGNPTEVIVGQGHFGAERPPAILQRRRTASTIFGNVADISGIEGGFVRRVVQSGTIEDGHAWLTIETIQGTDTALASYRPGLKSTPGLVTDAQQALVRRDGTSVRALYLGGGLQLTTEGGSLLRSAPGLAYVERAATGAWVVGNPSAEGADLTVNLPGITELEAWPLDVDNRRGAKLQPKAAAAGGIVLTLPPAGRIELSKPGTMGIHAQRQAVLLQRQAEREAADAAARAASKTRSDARTEAAKATPSPANTWIVARGPAFSAQGGGTVKPAPNRVGATGTVFSGWDGIGHWLEWTLEVPAKGYYNLSLLYCSGMEGAEREVCVNGEVQEPDATLTLPGTGGWSNSSDDWQLATLQDPVTAKPLLLRFKQGPNTVRLTNTTGRGANVDLLAVTSPDVTASRADLAARAPVEETP